MKYYDITQELLSCRVYPGDTAPRATPVRRTAWGDLYNLTDLSLCAHNGTHVDAPFHFLPEGKTLEQLPLEKTVGPCFVACFEGRLSVEDAENILRKAESCRPEASLRILLKGDATVTEAAAGVFADAGIFLLGVESQSVGEEAAPMAVHKLLLKKETVLLEGIRLKKVEEGFYFLFAAPLLVEGIDGAPCRAILIEGI